MTLLAFSEPPPSQTHQASGSVKTDSKDEEPHTQESNLSQLWNASKFPVVTLDVEVLTDTIAARLATSLLGHVLFLKNQIPLPVAQLARMRGNGKNNTKAAKQKSELLSSYDVLASHLTSTFTALSTAFAESGSTGPGRISRAYLAILVGPSIGTAKSKVIYALDSFAARVWGQGDHQDERDDDADSGDELPDDSEDEDGSEATGSEEFGQVGEDDEDDNTGDGSDEDDGEAEEAEEAEEESGGEDPSTPSYESYAEEQRFLQTADRLLSRTLASADAEGQGISNEMSPTQTHILIRAPRRFVHPSWIPRQNLTKQMDLALSEFLAESWPSDDKRPSTKKRQVEGVWVTGRSGLNGPIPQYEPTTTADPERDEIIWWSWDGKLVGFSDW